MEDEVSLRDSGWAERVSIDERVQLIARHVGLEDAGCAQIKTMLDSGTYPRTHESWIGANLLQHARIHTEEPRFGSAAELAREREEGSFCQFPL
jgi:hypothetical protein